VIWPRSVHPPEYQSTATQSTPSSHSCCSKNRHSRQEKSAPCKKSAIGRSSDGDGRRNVVGTDALSAGVSISTPARSRREMAQLAAGSEMVPPSRGGLGANGVARGAAIHGEAVLAARRRRRLLAPMIIRSSR